MTGIDTFKTTTEELIALSDWLTTEGCTHIVMEATGATAPLQGCPQRPPEEQLPKQSMRFAQSKEGT
jgi:hypothetical protein